MIPEITALKACTHSLQSLRSRELLVLSSCHSATAKTFYVCAEVVVVVVFVAVSYQLLYCYWFLAFSLASPSPFDKNFHHKIYSSS